MFSRLFYLNDYTHHWSDLRRSICEELDEAGSCHHDTWAEDFKTTLERTQRVMRNLQALCNIKRSTFPQILHTHTNILYQSTQTASLVLKPIFEIWVFCQEYIMFMFTFSLPTYNMLFTQCISFRVITLEESMMLLQPTLLCSLIPPHTHAHIHTQDIKLPHASVEMSQR